MPDRGDCSDFRGTGWSPPRQGSTLLAGPCPVNLVTRFDGKGLLLRYDGQSHSEKKVEL